MSDNDLIRRGDARGIIEDEGFMERNLQRLAAIPAVQPTVSPDVAALVEAAEAQLQYMDMCNDKGDLERNLRATLARVKGESK